MCFLQTNNSTVSIFVNLFLCLELYSKILIDPSGYFVYNSNQPTGRLLNSGFFKAKIKVLVMCWLVVHFYFRCLTWNWFLKYPWLQSQHYKCWSKHTKQSFILFQLTYSICSRMWHYCETQLPGFLSEILDSY